MRSVIPQLASSFALALTLVACDSTLGPSETSELDLAQAALSADDIASWDVDVAVSARTGALSFGVSLIVDEHLGKRTTSNVHLPTGPRPTPNVFDRGTATLRLVDVASGRVLAASAIIVTVGDDAGATLDVTVADPCDSGAATCQRSLRLEVAWDGPGPVVASPSLAAASDVGDVVLHAR